MGGLPMNSLRSKTQARDPRYSFTSSHHYIPCPRLFPVNASRALRSLSAMDWITASIETIGILIFVFWFIVPIREFKQIFRRIKEKPPLAEPSERAFPPI